jgi:hypothetical protein
MQSILKITFLSILLAMPILIQAQLDRYTYVTDRRFPDPTDLLGWQFRPSEMEIPESHKEKLLPGDYRFGITQNNLFVEGGDISGVYSINNINPTEYGYMLLLINARNPTLQGHLKVILNKGRQADAVIFKRSPSDPEIIFWMPLLSEKDFNVEKEWFTGRRELFLPEIDSLWGQSLAPFILIDLASNKQQRLQMDDSTALYFSREIAYEIKDKKKRKKGEVSLVDSLELTVEDLLADSMLREEAGVIVEQRIADFMRFKTRIYYDDGGTKWIEDTHEIKQITEKSDRKAQDSETKYMWEIELKNKDIVYLFFNSQRYATMLEWGSSRYLMRGF